MPVYINFKIASHTHFDYFCSERCAMCCVDSLASLLRHRADYVSGVDSQGVDVMAQQVPRRTRSGSGPQQSAWWHQHRQLAVQSTKNSCVGHLLVAVPRYYLTHQSRSPVLLLFLHFSLQIPPSCDNSVPQ